MPPNTVKNGEEFEVCIPNSVTITLPPWAATMKEEYEREYKTDEEKMALAVSLSDRNIVEQTGGPFGAAIFERFSNHSKLVAIGVNRVVTLSNSTLHAETVAIAMAQSKLKNFTLNFPNREFELFTSCEPCCMCVGATLWSGVSRMVSGATKADASAIGFDEGPVFEESYEHLKRVGIDVRRDVLREKAADVLKRYGEIGVIYNR